MKRPRGAGSFRPRLPYPNPNPEMPGTMLVPLGYGIRAIIDEADAPAVGEYMWCLKKGSRTNYATTRMSEGKNVMLHRFLLGLTGELPQQLDHINGNGLDNRRANLRAATHEQNTHNSRMPSTNTSGYKGVSKCAGGWRAMIRINKRNVWLGVFETPEAAHACYCAKAKETRGAFARVA